MGDSKWARLCLWLSMKLHRPVFGYSYIDPLESWLGAITGLAMIGLIVQHGEQVGGMLEEMTKPLRWLLDDDE